MVQKKQPILKSLQKKFYHINCIQRLDFIYCYQTIKIRLYSLLSRNFKILEIKTNKKDSKEGILDAGIKMENFENVDNLCYQNSFSQNKLSLLACDDYIIEVKGKNTRIVFEC